ncbi:MAG: hypothetical protein RIR01_1097 [Bacteroidota bacterium]|jgi:hypothetical protein
MNKISLFFAIVFVLLIGTATYAQAEPDPTDDTPAAPIDGGITAIFVGGLIYGAKKLNDKKNPK